MVGCIACGAVGAGPLCAACRRSLTPGTRFLTADGLLVGVAHRHHGTGRVLVHRLKYQAMPLAAEVLAAGMAALVPASATALVPVPRARVRRWWYGVDPAQRLAAAVGRRTGLPVVDALAPALWWPRHAGMGDAARSPVPLRSLVAAEPGWVLVDDVATSGATLAAAAAACGGAVHLGLVATAPSRMRVEARTGASSHQEVA